VVTYLSDPGRSSFNGETTITAANAAGLTETWSAAGRGSYVGTQPIVANGVIYWGDYNGYEHATNAATGQELWAQYLGSYFAGPISQCVPDQMGVLGAATVGQVNGRTLVFVPGGGPRIGTNSGPVAFFALDPTSGHIVWQTQVGTSPVDDLWSSPLLYNGSIFEGIASHGACPARTQGRLVKLDAASGAIQATFAVVPSGCVGGGIWGSPTVDEATGLVYIASAEADCGSATPSAQSIIALRASDLRFVGNWHQGDPAGEDHDFGSTPTLFSGGGRSLVGVDNKNGEYYAFDRTNLGAGPVWTYNLARAGESPEAGDGSISPAAWDGTTLYVAGGTSPDGSCQGTLQALDPATGTAKWKDCLAGPVIPAVTAAPGLLVVGAGSHLVVVNATTGAVLWSWADPDGREFWAAPTLANGTLYAANSGYGGPTTVPGRLYAFNVATAGAPSTATPVPVVGSQPGCPSGWSCSDIGGPAVAGSDALTNSTWTVRSSGYDIWQMADQCHFDYQTMGGDGSASARVISQTASDPWAKAGVMLRTSIAPGAAFYDAVVTPGNGISVQYRSPAGVSAVIQASLAGAVPTYLKVTRAGTSFSASTSPDGVTWTLIEGSTIALAGMTGALLGGVAVTVHSFAGSATVTFNTVSVTGGRPAAPGIGHASATPVLAPPATMTPTPVAVAGGAAGRGWPPPTPSMTAPTATITAVPRATDSPQPRTHHSHHRRKHHSH
jgi:outer membrane protein assembly factor BamB